MLLWRAGKAIGQCRGGVSAPHPRAVQPPQVRVGQKKKKKGRSVHSKGQGEGMT